MYWHCKNLLNINNWKNLFMIPYTIHPRPYTITYEIFYFLVPHTIPKDCLNFSNNLAKNFREIVCCKPCLTNCPCKEIFLLMLTLMDKLPPWLWLLIIRALDWSTKLLTAVMVDVDNVRPSTSWTDDETGHQETSFGRILFSWNWWPLGLAVLWCLHVDPWPVQDERTVDVFTIFRVDVKCSKSKT